MQQGCGIHGEDQENRQTSNVMERRYKETCRKPMDQNSEEQGRL